LNFGGQELTIHLQDTVSGDCLHDGSVQYLTRLGTMCLSHIEDRLSTNKSNICKPCEGLCSGLGWGNPNSLRTVHIRGLRKLMSGLTKGCSPLEKKGRILDVLL